MARVAIGTVTVSDIIDGERGSRAFYGTVTNGQWSDTAANAVITGEGHTKVLYDQVTLSDEANGFSETRYWNSSWIKIDSVIDGNLIVGGTLTIGGEVLTTANTLNSSNTAASVGARPDSWTPTASDVGADPVGSAADALEDSYKDDYSRFNGTALTSGTSTYVPIRVHSDSVGRWMRIAEWTNTGAYNAFNIKGKLSYGSSGRFETGGYDFIINLTLANPYNVISKAEFKTFGDIGNRNLRMAYTDTGSNIVCSLYVLMPSTWEGTHISAEWYVRNGVMKVWQQGESLGTNFEIPAGHTEVLPKENAEKKEDGTVGGWNIDSGHIWSGTQKTSDGYSTKGITLDKDGAIRAPKFRLETNGDAYFKGTINIGGTEFDESNGISASDVGARPDSWTPSASDVGARADTWVPTKSQVGLDSVENKSSATIRSEITKANITSTGLSASDVSADPLGSAANIVVSGKNLCRRNTFAYPESTPRISGMLAHKTTTPAGDLTRWYTNLTDRIPGDHSISFWAKASSATNVTMDFCDENSNAFALTTEWEYFKFEGLDTSSTYLYHTSYYGFLDFITDASVVLEISELKIEHGNKATAYSIPPEEVRDKTDGTVGGWNIDSGYIWSGTQKTSDGYSTKGITLASGGAIRAPKFRLDTNGNAHFLGGITGSTVTGATINGSTITGGTLQTDTTGKRVVLTNSNDLLTLYNQDNEAVFGTDVDASGNVELFFKGRLRNDTIDDALFFTSAGIASLRSRLGMFEPSVPTGGTISYGTSGSMTGDFQITGSGDENRIFSGGNVMTMSLQASGSYTYTNTSSDHTSANTPVFTVQFYKRTSANGTTWGSWVAEGALKTITGYKSSYYVDFGGETGYTNRWDITVGCSINVSEPVGTVDGTYYQVRAVVAQTAGHGDIDNTVNSSLSSFIADEPANGSIAAHRHNWSDLDNIPTTLMHTTGASMTGRLTTTKDLQFTGTGVGSGIMFNSTIVSNDAAGIRQNGTNNVGELEFFTTDDDTEPFVFRHYTTGQTGEGSNVQWMKVDATGIYEGTQLLSAKYAASSHTHSTYLAKPGNHTTNDTEYDLTWENKAGALYTSSGDLSYNPANKRITTGVFKTAGGDSNNWNTAYGWGNHASQGYKTTDTNTHRAIHDSPSNGSTTTSISSNWAYDHAASSTAHPRDTRSQIAGSYAAASHTHSYLPLAGGKLTGELAFPEKQVVNRRFEMIENASPQYILLCVNAGNNDVNGRVTMDRTSGNWQACQLDIVVSSSTSAMQGGTIRSLVATQSNEEYTLVTLTHDSVSYVAIQYTGNTYPETTGAWFTGRISSTGSSLTVVSTGVSAVTPLASIGKFEINGHTIYNAGNNNIGTGSTNYAAGNHSHSGYVTAASNDTISATHTYTKQGNPLVFDGGQQTLLFKGIGHDGLEFQDGTIGTGKWFLGQRTTNNLFVLENNLGNETQVRVITVEDSSTPSPAVQIIGRRLIVSSIVQGTTVESTGHVLANGGRFLSNGTALIVSHEGTNSGDIYLRPKGENTTSGQFRVNSNGTCTMSGTIQGTDIIATSDRRVKKNLVRIDNALEKLDRITGYTFTRTDMDDRRHGGTIAQDWDSVMPEAVIETEDAKLGTKLTVSAQAQIGFLVECIKELKAEIKEIKHG